MVVGVVVAASWWFRLEAAVVVLSTKDATVQCTKTSRVATDRGGCMAEAAARPAGRRPRLSRERVLQAALSVGRRRRSRGRSRSARWPRSSASSRCRSTTTSTARTRSSPPWSTSSSARSSFPDPAGLAGGDARAGLLGTRGAGPAPLGDRAARVAHRIPGRPTCATTTPSSRPCGPPGFSPELTAHAYALLDSYVYGFALQEADARRSRARRASATSRGPIMERMADGRVPAPRRDGDVVLPAARLRLRRRVRVRPRPDPRRAGGGAQPRGCRPIAGGGKPPERWCNGSGAIPDVAGVVAPPGPPSGWCHGFSTFRQEVDGVVGSGRRARRPSRGMLPA